MHCLAGKFSPMLIVVKRVCCTTKSYYQKVHGCDLWITVGRVLTSPLRTRPRAIGPGFVKDAKLSDVRVGVGFW